MDDPIGRAYEAGERAGKANALDELERLRVWKAEAMAVLTEWERVWEAAGRPGPLGESKAENVRLQIERSRDGRGAERAVDVIEAFFATNYVCTCGPEYIDRGLIAVDCTFHDIEGDGPYIVQALADAGLAVVEAGR